MDSTSEIEPATTISMASPAAATASPTPTDPTFKYRRAARSERTWRAYEFDWADFRG
ncbi:MAG: hypothetical protein M0Z95_07120 [Actinomycetota bacterium]|jgi:hypothetical protein|nr:hypothetical protein [Actinomycetota bacterium]